MGRMLGMAGHDPLPLRKALDAFFPGGSDGKGTKQDSPAPYDGWGVSGFSAGRAVYFERRAEWAAGGRDLLDVAVGRAERAKTPVIVAHLRQSTGESRDVANTQPFHYRDWVFAHEGGILNAADLALQDAQPQGKTDSERFMLWLVEKMIPDLDPAARFVEAIQEARSRLNYTSFNLMISDGQTLWAYREAGDAKLENGETLSDREKKCGLHVASLAGSALVCSEPLKAAAKTWTALPSKTLAVISVQQPKPRMVAV